MHRPHRRTLLRAGLALPVAAMTAGAADAAGAGSATEIRESIDNGVATHNARWEVTPLATVLDDCHHWSYLCGQVGTSGDADWEATAAHVALLDARAHLDSGLPDRALELAQRARMLARGHGDLYTELRADLVAAGVWDATRPESYGVPDAILAKVRTRGRVTWLAATAAVLGANLSARRGDVDATVLLVKGAERLAGQLGASSPGDYNRAHVAAFSANALVRAGLGKAARPRLSLAAYLAEDQGPGLRSAVALYESRAALDGGDRAEAASHARRALDISAGRPASWLARSVIEQARQAGDGYGWDMLANRAGSWQMA